MAHAWRHTALTHVTRHTRARHARAQVKNARPGVLSDELREALGMGDGAPPPWLINMQRYGPPPSYPNLR